MLKPILLAAMLFTLPLIGQGEAKQEEVLNFWFGTLEGPADFPLNKAPNWFRKDPEFDQEIKRRFEMDVLKASRGKYASWKETPKGRLALIILLDQFPRNIFRDTPQAFRYDEKAQAIVLEGLDQGQDTMLYPVERLFFYMPLQHAEDTDLQNLSLKKYEQLTEAAPQDIKKFFTMQWAVRHWEIIQMFGRFPHRNFILDRPSTKQEKIFLQLPDSSF